MLIKTLVLGPIENNCYVVTDESTLDCAVIDPAGDATYLLDYLEDNRLHCRLALLTHAHFDHVGAVAELMEETGAQLYMHPADNGTPIGFDGNVFAAPEGTRFLSDGDMLDLGGIRFTVYETPGHTPGGLTYLAQQGEDRVLFTGDTLFRDSCGRTDFRLSDGEAMLRSLRRLAALPGDYEVCPGHGFATTLDRERRVNYFMRMATQG